MIKLVTFEEADAICRRRGCVCGIHNKIILDVVATGHHKRRPPTEVRPAQIEPVVRWPVIEVLRACRVARGLKVPRSALPPGLEPHKRLDERAIAEALAADGIPAYQRDYRGPRRSDALLWALGEDGARVKDPARIAEVLIWSGLVRERPEGGMVAGSTRADFTGSAIVMTRADDDAVSALLPEQP